MGLLANLFNSLCERCSTQSLWVLVTAGIAAFIALAVVLNVLSQLLFKNPKEPPVVFHWFPVIGSTVTYGIEPYKFFANCQKKVRMDVLHTSNRRCLSILGSVVMLTVRIGVV